ncbi:hypothetical protein OSL05_24390, partial [Escherichia coli]|nr:hypothetical protein [Escherichia coli]
ADRNRSHWSTSKTPSYTKSVSWQHHRPGEAERILVSGEYWQRQKTLLTEREVSFMKGLFRIVDMKRWYLCPQVRVADIVQLNGNIRPRSR